jgi:FkbM family methyltransferase
MSLASKARTFFLLLRTQPALLWEIIQIRVEHNTGIPLYFLSIRRLATRITELLTTAALTPALRPYGNYYLDPALLGNHPVVFSVGVGQHIEFDRALLDQHNVNLHLFDPTPASKRYIENTDIPARARFHPVAITDRDGTIDMYIDELETEFDRAASISIFNRGVSNKSFSVPCRRITSLMKEHALTKLDVLKLDIEGAAIRVLQDVLQDAVYPTQIACEFERPQSLTDVWHYLREVKALLARLKFLGYEIYRTRDKDRGCQIEIVAVRRTGAAA